ncbi:hypothetical protein [Paraburkholderia sp. MM5477-R1]
MSLLRDEADGRPFAPGVTQSAIDTVRCHRSGGSSVLLAFKLTT